MAAPKLDIFRTLAAANAGNYDYYASLTPEEQKAFATPVIMRWLSGTDDPSLVMSTDMCLNKFIFKLHKHPELIWKLMVASRMEPTNTRYQWMKQQSATTTGKGLVIQVISEYLKYNSLQAQDAMNLLSSDQILLMAEELGWQKEEITKLKKELK